MEANQMQPGTRDQCGQALQELQRRHHDMGGAVAPGTFELEHDLACAIALETLVSNRRAGDVMIRLSSVLSSEFLNVISTRIPAWLSLRLLVLLSAGCAANAVQGQWSDRQFANHSLQGAK